MTVFLGNLQLDEALSQTVVYITGVLGLFNTDIMERRFGCGLSPKISSLRSLDEVLSTLGEHDPSELRYPIEPFPTFQKRLEKRRGYSLRRNEEVGLPGEAEMRRKIQALAIKARLDGISWARMQIQRRVWTRNGFRERLVFFWGDHFTAIGKNGVTLRGMSPYLETGIRPYITGNFSDLLISAITHPLMLDYLDQIFSIGPNSKNAKSGIGGSKGLNENLAREVLELHTLGVDGPYTQSDVHELARLFTGMTSSADRGFHFCESNAEPGLKTVLDIPYGRHQAGRLSDVESVLRDLAVHPVTAHHISRKLAFHFLGENAGADIITVLTDRFLDTKGDLTAVYDAMLSHPRAWEPKPEKVKNPLEFVSSSLRAIAPDPNVFMSYSRRFFRTRVLEPMAMMGQPWEHPMGPDGWPEEPEAWISPQGLAARIQWAFSVPRLFRSELPATRDLLRSSLGARGVCNELRHALLQVDSDWENVGLGRVDKRDSQVG